MNRKTLILIATLVTLLATKGLALEVRPQDISGYPQQTVTVSINVTEATKAIDAFGMIVTYDPACLSFEGLSKVGLTADFYLLDANELEPGKLKIGGFGINAVDTVSGVLTNFRFRIKNKASAYCEISLEDFVADLEGATTSPAKITIYSFPSPPSNLRATSISSNRVELGWDDDNPLNGTGFILERKTEGGAYLQIAEVLGNAFTDTGVNPNTIYYYRVKAYDNSMSSDFSNEISIVTPIQDITPPLPFNPLSPESDVWISNSLPNFSWSPSFDDESDLDGYFLYIDGALNKILPPDVLEAAPNIPLSNGPHVWKVVAKNRSGLTTSSDTSLIKVDTLKPETDLIVGFPNYNQTYIKLNTPLSLLANDQGSGISSINYKIDGGEWKSDTVPISMGREGQHTLRVSSTDRAGNREDIKTFNLFIDEIPPLTSNDAPSGWRSDTVTINLTANDTGCGVASTYYTVFGDTPTTAGVRGNQIILGQDGIWKIGYFSVDNLGNAEAPKYTEVKINRFPPNFSYGYLDPKNNRIFLHFSEGVRQNTGAQIKINGRPLTENETISETEGGKTLIINLRDTVIQREVLIAFDEGSLSDLDGNPILDVSEHLLYLLVEGEAKLKGLIIENSLSKPLAFRCQEISDTLTQIIEEANKKAANNPKISRMLEAAYQVEAITLQGEDCGENLSGLILLKIPYKQEDNIEDLRAYRLNEDLCQWEIVEDGGINEPDRLNRVVKVEVSHLSVFSLGVTKAPASDLSGAKAYPNPFMPGDAKYGALEISFKGLTLDAEIKIFTIAGELVKILRADTNGEASWKAANEAGKEVASGVYIYLITNPKGEKKAGKIAVIR